MFRTAILLAMSLVPVALMQAADNSQEGPTAVERLLLGRWRGGACRGQLNVKADGTFARIHYSPGNNKLYGTWEMRWNALPPTLVLKCKSSDDADYVGTVMEVKLVQLDDKVLAYRFANDDSPIRYDRISPDNP